MRPQLLEANQPPELFSLGGEQITRSRGAAVSRPQPEGLAYAEDWVALDDHTLLRR